MSATSSEAKTLLAEAGKSDHEYELISRRRRLAEDRPPTPSPAQMRDAGLKVKRTVLPGRDLLERLDQVSLLLHRMARPAAGRAGAGAGLQIGRAWNESGYSDPEFDALLDKALATPDAEARREIMAKIEKNLRNSGIIIQPYWRSVYRTYRNGVHGCEQHQALEQHFEKAWIES